MPRPRKRLKSLVRQMPRTTGILVTGSCGHQSKERIRVDTWGDYEPNKLLKLEEQKQNFLAESLTMLCKDCIAESSIRENRIKLKELTDWLEIDDFIELDGSPRMNAYAQDVRVRMTSGEITNISRSIIDRLNSQSFVDQILLSTLKRAWPIDENDFKSEDILNLYKEMASLSFTNEIGYNRISKERSDITLAIWLLLKYRLPSNFMLNNENRAKVWITITRARYGSPLLDIRDVPSEVYLSAIIVSHFNCWEDRYSAWEAFNTLNSLTSDELTQFIEKRSENSSSFKDLLKEARVVSALLGETSKELSTW